MRSGCSLCDIGRTAELLTLMHVYLCNGVGRAMNDDTIYFSMRRRAYDLAESGRYKHWRTVANALLAEGFVGSMISRLDADSLAVMMITRCCEQARA